MGTWNLRWELTAKVVSVCHIIYSRLLLIVVFLRTRLLLVVERKEQYTLSALLYQNNKGGEGLVYSSYRFRLVLFLKYVCGRERLLT